MGVISTFWVLDLVIITLLLSFFVYKYVTRRFGYWEKRGIPVLPPQPFFGNFEKVFKYKESMAVYLWHLYNIIKEPFFGIYVIDQPCLVLRDPKLIKKVLYSDYKLFESDSVEMRRRSSEPIVNTHMFVRNRRYSKTRIDNLLSSDNTKGVISLMNRKAQQVTNNKVDGSIVSLKDVSVKYSIEIMATYAFGPDQNPRRMENILNEIKKNRFYPKTMNRFSRFVLHYIPNLLSNFGWTTSDYPNFEDFDDSSDVFVGSSEVDPKRLQFFLSGFETIASTICFALYEMALHNEIQNELRREVIANVGDDERLSVKTLRGLRYLDMCIKETLRKYPVFPYLERISSSDIFLPGTELFIEKGVPFKISLLGLHNDPEYFSKPDVFDPERFSDENEADISIFTYVPFGEGSRKCIGGEFGLLAVKIFVAYYVKHFVISRCPRTPDVVEFDLKSFILKPKNELLVEVTSINT